MLRRTGGGPAANTTIRVLSLQAVELALNASLSLLTAVGASFSAPAICSVTPHDSYASCREKICQYTDYFITACPASGSLAAGWHVQDEFGFLKGGASVLQISSFERSSNTGIRTVVYNANKRCNATQHSIVQTKIPERHTNSLSSSARG